MDRKIFTKIALIILLTLGYSKVNPIVIAACCNEADVAFTGQYCPSPGQTECPYTSGFYCDDPATECSAYLQNNPYVPQVSSTGKAAKVCNFVPGGAQRDECSRCFDEGKAWTAIGCIPTTPSGFIQKFLGLGVGIAGGIAFLLIIFGGLQILTSAGNPEKLNAGKELVSAAISGLMLIIFSIFLLRLIGVNILQLPEFGPT